MGWSCVCPLAKIHSCSLEYIPSQSCKLLTDFFPTESVDRIGVPLFDTMNMECHKNSMNIHKGLHCNLVS